MFKHFNVSAGASERSDKTHLTTTIVMGPSLVPPPSPSHTPQHGPTSDLPSRPRPGHTHSPCQGDAPEHGPALLGPRPRPCTNPARSYCPLVPSFHQPGPSACPVTVSAGWVLVPVLLPACRVLMSTHRFLDSAGRVLVPAFPPTGSQCLPSCPPAWSY